MHPYSIYILGFVAQAFFGARTIAQWISSEREGRVVSPVVFWVFSLAGASLFLVYGIMRADVVIMLGQTIAFYIYVRNLQLKKVWYDIHRPWRALLLTLPPLLLLAFILTEPDFSAGNNFSDIYLFVGMAGQLLLNFRYFYQWYYSELAKDSILPLGFWVISAFASVLVIVYGIFREDPVLLVAQSGGLLAYGRNIYLHLKST